MPIYCENLFKQVDEKKAGGAKENFEVSQRTKNNETNPTNFALSQELCRFLTPFFLADSLQNNEW